MHESVHAFLVNYFKQDSYLANPDYATMVTGYANNTNPNVPQRDEMVRDFVIYFLADKCAVIP